ncbi:hypothetical protein AB0O28_28815 [Microbispora sp. NPDC088329]|uniref:hypothetical protein n=1 Tax=Microbispora sp. NPDC088329 TaxID=3154869 RepID=UPI003426D31A
MIVPEADLGRLTFLAKGAFAEVYRVEEYTLPGDPAPLAYKKFIREHAAQARSARTTVGFRDDLSPSEQRDLDRFAAWPKALVTDAAGDVCGVLMVLLPEDFFCRQLDDSGQMTTAPREFSWLISTAAQRAAAQVDIRDIEFTERLVLLAQLAYFFGRLHKHGWVYGDCSFRNMAFALDPPRLKVLDCDGAAALTDTSREQASTFFWDPPECPISPPPGQRRQQELQDDVTDVYKLGLAILRCLTPGKGAPSTRAVSRLSGELDSEGTDLLTRALSADRSTRPTSKELYLYLRGVVASRTSPPGIVHARVATPYRVRGMDVRVEWRVTNATTIEIRTGSEAPITLDAAQHPDGCVFRPARSGRVTLEARNDCASVTMDLGELTLYELPAFDLSLHRLPTAHVPPMETFQPPSPAAALPGRPRIAAGFGAVELPSLHVFDFVHSMLPVEPALMPAPRISAVVSEATGVVRASVTDAASDMAAVLHRTFIEKATADSSEGAQS